MLLTAAVSLLKPASAMWINTKWISYLLMVIMFAMGLTLKTDDFVTVFKRPKDIFSGIIAQYMFMPVIAFVLCRLFNLDAALTAGVVLVGTCPGGTASNVMTYFAKGDIALSVCMTSVNTLLAPLLTPILTYIFLKTTVKVDLLTMFIGIINVILIPVAAGFILNKYFEKYTQKAVKLLPFVSTVAICMIIGSVVSHNADKIYTSGALILAVVVLHNCFGYLCGFIFAKILKMPNEKIKAFSIETGMQNSGLATSLAGISFPSLASATVPGAIFSVWHNISGAVLAGIYRNYFKNSDETESL